LRNRSSELGPPQWPGGPPEKSPEPPLEDLQLLFVVESQGEPGDIAAWVSHAGNEAPCHRIAADGKHDWNRRGRLLGRQGRSRACGDDQVDVSPDEVGREFRQLILVLSIAWLESDILTLDQAHPTQGVNESVRNRLIALSQMSNVPYSFRLLCVDGERCPARAEGNPTNECSSIHHGRARFTCKLFRTSSVARHPIKRLQRVPPEV
jgi:hypothetical protein